MKSPPKTKQKNPRTLLAYQGSPSCTLICVLFLDLGAGYMGEFTENSSSCTHNFYTRNFPKGKRVEQFFVHSWSGVKKICLDYLDT